MDGTLPLEILFVEDLPSDTDLAVRTLSRAGIVFRHRRVETQGDFTRALEESRPDIIISDYAMPAFNGMEALRLCQAFDQSIPFIILTGSMNEDTAVDCMKAGASDYVIKEHMRRLPFAVSESLERLKLKRENEQREIESRLEQKLRAMGQLAAGITHEINTPLGFVANNIQFLQTALAKLRRSQPDCSDLDEMIQALDESASGISHIIEIVRAMKDFSHPDYSAMVSFDINRSIRNASIISRNEWKYVAEMRLDLAPDLPEIIGVPDTINQVILNMIVNAAQAIDEKNRNGGSRGSIAIGSRTQGNGVEISIADTGAGIPPEVQAKMFTPFFTTKGTGVGTGQGLFLAQMIVVKRHHGTLRFTSTAGKGTTFFIWLPFDPNL